MYGTVGRYKFKRGTTAEIMKEMKISGVAAGMPEGGIAMYAFQMDRDPDEVFIVAVTESKEAYQAIADSPEMNAQYEFLSQHFAEEPQWNDGHIIQHEMASKIRV